MEIQNKNLETLLVKAEADPEIMEIMRNLVRWCQIASEAGITLQELAAVGTVGWQIDISGELVKPQGALLLDRKRATFNPLIKLRADFNPEMSASVTEIK